MDERIYLTKQDIVRMLGVCDMRAAYAVFFTDENIISLGFKVQRFKNAKRFTHKESITIKMFILEAKEKLKE